MDDHGHKAKMWRTDGRTGGQMRGQTDGGTNERMEGQTADGRMNGQTDGWIVWAAVHSNQKSSKSQLNNNLNNKLNNIHNNKHNNKNNNKQERQQQQKQQQQQRTYRQQSIRFRRRIVGRDAWFCPFLRWTFIFPYAKKERRRNNGRHFLELCVPLPGIPSFPFFLNEGTR